MIFLFSGHKDLVAHYSRDAPDTVFAGYPANPKAGNPAG
jgi:hypothetical protein